MITHTTTYSSQKDLVGFIEKKQMSRNDSLLIQVFSGLLNMEKVQTVLKSIQSLLPKAVVIGATTTGEIIKGKSVDETIVLVFTIFEKTTLRTVKYVGNEAHHLGTEDWLPVLDGNTKAVIIFVSGFEISPNQVINSLPNSEQDLIIAGGIAGDNNKLKNTYVFHQTHIINSGVVAVSLSSDELYVRQMMKFNWQPIGKPLTITNAQHNIIYEIEKKSISDIYLKYLGESVAFNLPGTASLFPLVHKRNGVLNSNIMLQTTPEGGGLFTGEFVVGEKVQLAYANSEMLLENNIMNEVKEESPQSIFVYSCGGRKSILGSAIDKEIMPLDRLAPTNGFFTYGEFFTGTNGVNNILNNTMTILLLSELQKQGTNTRKIEHEKTVNESIVKRNDFIFTDKEFNQSLKHFTKVITHELMEVNQKLEHQNKELLIAKNIKDRELEALTLATVEKNKLLHSVVEQLSQLVDMSPDEIPKELVLIQKSVHQHLNDDIWEGFFFQFKKAHPDFFVKLKTSFPKLTSNDLKLCAYLKVGMGNKEAAQMSGINSNSMKKNINRLKKKIGLSAEEDLRGFLIPFK